jgi:hypothetical protein
MGNVKSQTKNLDFILNSNNSPVLKRLNPGLSSIEITEFFKNHGLKQWQGLIELFEWKNGTIIPKTPFFNQSLELFPDGIFYSLDTMIEFRKEIISSDLLDQPERYYPIFGSCELDSYCFNNETGEIVYYAPTIQIFGSPRFKTIEIMLDFIVNSYQKGLLKIDSKTGLEYNYEEFLEEEEKYKF